MSMGLKWKDQAKTMLYFSRDQNREELHLFAIRLGLVSFPDRFWGPRPQALAKAMNALPAHQRIRVEAGPFSSSQYSAGQLALNNRTEDEILRVVREVVVPEACRAGARL